MGMVDRRNGSRIYLLLNVKFPIVVWRFDSENFPNVDAIDKSHGTRIIPSSDTSFLIFSCNSSV